jgi:hypothetical protein
MESPERHPTFYDSPGSLPPHLQSVVKNKEKEIDKLTLLLAKEREDKEALERDHKSLFQESQRLTGQILAGIKENQLKSVLGIQAIMIEQLLKERDGLKELTANLGADLDRLRQAQEAPKEEQESVFKHLMQRTNEPPVFSPSPVAQQEDQNISPNLNMFTEKQQEFSTFKSRKKAAMDQQDKYIGSNEQIEGEENFLKRFVIKPSKKDEVGRFEQTSKLDADGQQLFNHQENLFEQSNLLRADDLSPSKYNISKSYFRRNAPHYARDEAGEEDYRPERGKIYDIKVAKRNFEALKLKLCKSSEGPAEKSSPNKTWNSKWMGLDRTNPFIHDIVKNGKDSGLASTSLSQCRHFATSKENSAYFTQASKSKVKANQTLRGKEFSSGQKKKHLKTEQSTGFKREEKGRSRKGLSSERIKKTEQTFKESSKLGNKSKETKKKKTEKTEKSLKAKDLRTSVEGRESGDKEQSNELYQEFLRAREREGKSSNESYCFSSLWPETFRPFQPQKTKNRITLANLKASPKEF